MRRSLVSSLRLYHLNAVLGTKLWTPKSKHPEFERLFLQDSSETTAALAGRFAAAAQLSIYGLTFRSV